MHRQDLSDERHPAGALIGCSRRSISSGRGKWFVTRKRPTPRSIAIKAGGPCYSMSRLGARFTTEQSKQPIALAREAGEGWGEGRHRPSRARALRRGVRPAQSQPSVRFARTLTEITVRGCRQPTCTTPNSAPIRHRSTPNPPSLQSAQLGRHMQANPTGLRPISAPAPNPSAFLEPVTQVVSCRN
jgi:hypothetical protein